jgi:hypothetical protein
VSAPCSLVPITFTSGNCVGPKSLGAEIVTGCNVVDGALNALKLPPPGVNVPKSCNCLAVIVTGGNALVDAVSCVAVVVDGVLPISV